MKEEIHNNKRAVKNTLFLYLRMLFIMGVTLYASRVILDKLGVSDYGIYNSVGGVVALLAFLNNTLSTGTSRFLTFELGKGDSNGLKDTFNTAFFSHLLLAISVVVILEIFGPMFIKTQLVIPEDRIKAALWVFHLSVFTTFIAITQVPYTSVIIAHENMKIYAYVGIYEALARLSIVYLLSLVEFDSLIFYAVLVAIVQLSVVFVYRVFCIRKYEESHLTIRFSKTIFKNMLSFSGYSLLANISQVLSIQGLVVLINMFFQPVVAAAQAIGNQISGAMMQFVNNFRTAINPQIIKLYAAGEYEESKKLTLDSSVYVHELVLLIALPLIVVMDPILHWWLVEVPEYAVVFSQLILIKQILDVYNGTLYVPMIASGKIKNNSYAALFFGIGLFALLYLFLKWGFDVMWVQYLSLIQTMLFSYIIKPLILCKEIGYSYKEIIGSFSRVVKVSIIPIIVSILCYNYIELGNFWKILGIVLLICFSVVLSAYICLDKAARIKLRSYLVFKLRSVIHNEP